MNFGAIIIGDEILSGKRVDRHFAKMTELLGARGLRLSWAEYLGDERPRLAATLKRTLATGDAVFCFGGIGNTPDEWHELRRVQAIPLLLLGLVMALLAHVPLVGLLAPSLAALAYIHYCLEALRRLRQGAVVAVIDNSESRQ